MQSEELIFNDELLISRDKELILHDEVFIFNDASVFSAMRNSSSTMRSLSFESDMIADNSHLLIKQHRFCQKSQINRIIGFILIAYANRFKH